MSQETAGRLAARAVMLGDIAIVSIPDAMAEEGSRVAEAIMARHKRIRSVLNKTSKIVGDARVPHYELLSGRDTVAHYRENGFFYHFDVTHVFFNPRMSYEHRRIASVAKPGEDVLVPFCGVGPFVMPIASRGCSVVAIDNNSEACRWLAHNISINHLESAVDVLYGDAMHMPLRAKFDRAIVPTPYGMDVALEAIAGFVKPGGIVHFYTFKKKPQISGLIETYRNMGIETVRYRDCGNVARNVKRWAFDLKVPL